MENIYLAFVDTPGFFASLIRRTIKIPYVHVVLALDSNLTEGYSIGRRHPSIPFFAGFEQENLTLIHRAFPTARYKIVSLNCTLEQKAAIAQRLAWYYDRRFRYHYCIIGLPFLLLNIPFYQKRHYTCSSFTARLLEDCGIRLFNKHFSLVTPRDFYELSCTQVIYEGPLSHFQGMRYHSPNRTSQRKTAYEP